MLMMAKMAPLMVGGGGGGALRPQDVFSATPYTGTGATQTITTGLDLATDGGLVWLKKRSGGSGLTNHLLVDTLRGSGAELRSDSANGQSSSGFLSAIGSAGFTLGIVSDTNNISGASYASWSFKRAAGFFDIVIWVGDSSGSRSIPHALGASPGMVIIKAVPMISSWPVRHRSATGDLYLNTTAVQTGSFTEINAMDASTFTVATGSNMSGVTYVAYVFGHDPGPDGLIQCGSFTTDASANATVNLGWRPQYVLLRRVSGASGAWIVADTARGWGAGNDPYLVVSANTAEATGTNLGEPTATGFTSSNIGASSQCIYMAIREAA